MGEAPDGSGKREDVILQQLADRRAKASAAQAAEAEKRAARIRELAARYGFNESILGNNIERLVSLTMEALEGHGVPEFGIRDVVMLREFDQAKEQVAGAFRNLWRAIIEIYPMLPPEEGSAGFKEAVKKQPWLEFTDHFDGVVADLLGTNGKMDRPTALRLAADIRHVVSQVGGIPLPPDFGGRPRKTKVAPAIAAAVCYYRAEQGETRQWWWGRADPPGRPGQVHQKPVPQTAVASLMVLVAEAFELGVTNSELKTALDEYRHYLKASDRTPVSGDLQALYVTESVQQE